MKNGYVILLTFCGLAVIFLFGCNPVDASMVDDLKGKILLEVEDQGKAWYFHPDTLKRYYLGRPADALAVMRDVGQGITNENLQKIPVANMNLGGYDSDNDGLSDSLEIAFGTNKLIPDSDEDGRSDKIEILRGFDPAVAYGGVITNENFACKQVGKIFLQIENFGEAWYVSPVDCERYYLGRPADAFEIMRKLSIGISDENFVKLKEETEHIIDPGVSILRPSSNNGIKRYVAHALGDYNGFSGTNTLTAMESNYEKGYKLFEVDLSLTKDDEVVAFHVGQEDKYGLGEKEIEDITNEEFDKLLYRNELPTTDIEELLQFLDTNKDVYLVLDPKEDLIGVVESIVDDHSEYSAVFDRIIPQIYEPSQLKIVKDLYDFPDVIFTMYRIDIKYSELISFIRTSDITGVTMNYKNNYSVEFSELVQSLDIGVFVHTVNNKELIDIFHQDNVGVYTDNGK